MLFVIIIVHYQLNSIFRQRFWDIIILLSKVSLVELRRVNICLRLPPGSIESMYKPTCRQFTGLVCWQVYPPLSKYCLCPFSFPLFLLLVIPWKQMRRVGGESLPPSTNLSRILSDGQVEWHTQLQTTAIARQIVHNQPHLQAFLDFYFFDDLQKIDKGRKSIVTNSE